MTAARADLVVHGVEVVHLPSDDTVTHARLSFAAGSRDEVLSEQGVLHMVEHLAMHAVKDGPLETNASVGPSRTDFLASGPPELVAVHLERLCRALADPPVERMSGEAPVVAAEVDEDGGPHHALLAARYGFRDLGSGAVTGPGPDGLRPEQVRAAAGRWFVAENAVLLVDGPLPVDLALPLPAGGVPAHQRVAPRRRGGPAAVLLDGPACVASVLLPSPDARRLDVLAAELVRQRLVEVIRHEQGLTYALDDEVLPDVPHPAGGRGSDLVVGAEPLESRLVPAVESFVRTLLGLLTHGPQPEELDRARERLRVAREGRLARAEEELDGALAHRLGLRRPPLDAEALAAVGAAEVAAYLRPLLDDVLFALPDDPAVDLAALGLAETTVEPVSEGPLPAGRRFRPPLVARAISAAARQAELCLTPEGLHVRLEGRVQSVRWDDVVGVLEEDDDEQAVFGADGSVIVVGAGPWRGGAALTAAVRSSVDPALVLRRSTLLSGPED